jgi:hypothetical protein
MVHYDTEEQFEAASKKLVEAFTFSDNFVAKPKLVKASIS